MFTAILAGTAVVCAIAAVTAFFQIKTFVDRPANPKGQTIVFTIPQGQTLATIARNLEKDQVITNALKFKLYARYKKAATRIKAGEYQLSSAMSPHQIMAALTSGRVRLYRFTVPEGLNMDETARLAQKAGLCSEQRFLALCRNPNLVKAMSPTAHTLEGYLYPDTYFFPKNTPCQKVIKKMTQTFTRVFTPQWETRARQTGFTVHEIVTLASIIEKETGNAAERPLIASVFHNRLKKRMRLESDPTVIYGVDDYHGRIRYRHLRRVTPYNTYQIKGLPLGPIANPGALALEAALYPAKSDYLFFVSKNDTTHQFSKTLKDHNRAVKRYQLNR
ncbi:MAG: endolytic transglycosylase MltG [Desulfobacter sp.]|nr:endolytic transglycosylase MltG [Desulfobacter sp.]